MPCKLCGDVCQCSSNPGSSNSESPAAPRWLPEVAVFSAEPVNAQEIPETSGQNSQSDCVPAPLEVNVEPVSAEPSPEDSSAWRQELSVRLNRYQSRRKPRPPRYPSLRLRFEGADSAAKAEVPVDDSTALIMPTISNRALSLDHYVQDFAELSQSAPADAIEQTSAAPSAPTAKILEFPRSWTPPPPPVDELAEPVMMRPRILEAPEIVPPPPALGGITIEPVHSAILEKRPGIDIPLQTAPLGRRFFAASVDGLIIATACLLFAFIFWKVTALRPPGIQAAGLVAGLMALFWAAYQYLLVVYAGTTPGLRLAGLELTRFDGTRASRRLRRWRILASFLSALSLGMGYGWVLLDEDSLCWHDRITRTYLGRAVTPNGQSAGSEPAPAKTTTICAQA